MSSPKDRNHEDYLANTKYAPRKVAENPIQCPACGNSITLEIYQHETPTEGAILIMVANCNKCGYRYREVVPAQLRDRGVEIEIRVDSEDALKILIYRSPYAHIIIPELSIEIVPGPANPGEITTVEGLLLHIAENLYPLCDTMEDPAKCYEVASELIKAANGDRQLRIVIRDPTGLSLVIRGSKQLYAVRDLENVESSKSGIQVVLGRSTQP